MSLSLSMKSLVTVQRRTGTTSATWADAHTFRARVSQTGGQEIEQGKNVVAATHKLRAPFGTDVTERDQLVIDGTKYNVLLVTRNAHGANKHVMCELRELR